MAVLSHVFSVHKFTNEIYSKWQYITVQGRTDIGLFRSLGLKGLVESKRVTPRLTK